MSWKSRYYAVLNSKRWKEMRQRRIAKSNGRCEMCQERKKPLQLHHETYARLGAELDEDLILLCLGCHNKADQIRSMRNSTARYYARVEGWAEKVHGSNWESIFTYEKMEEMFDEWLDTQEGQ